MFEIKSYKEALLYLLLGLSPIGIFLPSLILWTLNICKGGLAQGITCQVEIFEIYPAPILLAFEAAMLLVVPGLIWLVFGLVVWYRLFKFVTKPFDKKLW